jgi:hypothetical protein
VSWVPSVSLGVPLSLVPIRWVAPGGRPLQDPRVVAGSLWACRDWGLLRDRSVHGRFKVVGWSPSGRVPSHRWRGWGDGVGGEAPGRVAGCY